MTVPTPQTGPDTHYASENLAKLVNNQDMCQTQVMNELGLDLNLGGIGSQ